MLSRESLTFVLCWSLSTKPGTGEPNGRAYSFPGCRDADSDTHRRFPRRPLYLSQRKTLATLFSNATGLSLLRYGTGFGGSTESKVSTRKRHLESIAESFSYQSEFRRYSRCFWCSRRAQR